MKLRSICAILLAAMFCSFFEASAQTAPAIRAISRELAEALGQRSARELAEVGGEAAVREVVEKAASEGGEQLARDVALFGQRYGAQSLKAFGHAPAAMTQAMKKVPAEFAEGAMRAAAREPQAIAKLAATVGEDALIVAAKHPGVGVDIASKLGREGCAVARQLSTPEAIRLARLSDDLGALPAAERAGVLTRISRSPAKVIDYLERHPNLLKSAASVGIAYVAIDALLGDAESPGFLERFAEKFRSPISGILVAVAILVAIRAGWWWKRNRRSMPSRGQAAP